MNQDDKSQIKHHSIRRYTHTTPPPPTLFIYTVTPQQVYTSDDTNSPVTLNISVYNPKRSGLVACKYIEFGISIGTSANDMTDDETDVKGQSNQSTWAIQKQPYVQSPLIFKV